MRKPNRYIGHKVVTVGPSVVRKHLEENGTCPEVLIAAHARLHTEKPSRRGKADPFGLENNEVGYSLNKKQRWLIPQILEEDIEELQDANVRLRVTGAIHRQDKCRPLVSKQGVPKDGDSAPVVGLFTVDGNGQTIRKSSRSGAKLRTLTDPPKPSRKELKKSKKAGIVQEELKAPEPLVSRHEEIFHPVHYRYSVLDISQASTSLYNSKKQCKEQPRRTKCSFNRAKRIADDSDCDESFDEYIFPDFDDEIPSPSDVLQSAQRLTDFITLPNSSGKRERSRKIRPLGDEVVAPKAPITTIAVMESTVHDWDVPRIEPMDGLVEIPELRGCTVEISEEMMETCTILPVLPRTFVVHAKHSARVFGSLLVDILRSRTEKIWKEKSRALLRGWHPPLAVIRRKCRKQTVQLELEELWVVRQEMEEKTRHWTKCIVVKQISADKMHFFEMERCDECSFARPARKQHELQIFSQIGIQDQSDVPSCSAIPSDCMICFETLYEPFGLKCGHLFCVSCWLSHVSASVEETAVPVSCMIRGCQMKVSLQAARALLSSPSLSTYRAALMEKVIVEQVATECPACHHFIPRDHSRAPREGLRCLCGANICGICNQRSHFPITCAAFAEYSELLEGYGLTWEQLSSLTSVTALVECPSCNRLMQKNGGCNHMSCLCGSQFCYNCGELYNDRHGPCRRRTLKTVRLVNVVVANASRQLPPRVAAMGLNIRRRFHEERKAICARIRLLPNELRHDAKRIVHKATEQLELLVLAQEMKRQTTRGEGKISLVEYSRIEELQRHIFDIRFVDLKTIREKIELMKPFL